MFRHPRAVLAAALFLSTFSAVPAKAALQLAVTDGSVRNVVNDCALPGPLCAIFFTGDYNGSAGVISTDINQSTGPFFDQEHINQANINASGSPALPMGQLSLTDMDLESEGPTTIKVYLTNTDQTSPVGLSILSEALSATSLSGNVTVSLQGFEDNSNSAFGTPSSNATSIATVTPHAGGAVASATTLSNALNFSAPYSITEVATINFLTAGDLNLNFTGILQASPVPEPGSILLFGTVALCIGVAFRRRLLSGRI